MESSVSQVFLPERMYVAQKKSQRSSLFNWSGLTCRRWAKVMVNYHRASKVVDPYREAIRSGEVNLEELVAARQSSAIG